MKRKIALLLVAVMIMCMVPAVAAAEDSSSVTTIPGGILIKDTYTGKYYDGTPIGVPTEDQMIIKDNIPYNRIEFKFYMIPDDWTEEEGMGRAVEVERATTVSRYIITGIYNGEGLLAGTGALFEIVPCQLVITAKDQTIKEGQQIAVGPEQVTIQAINGGMAEGASLNEITLTVKDGKIVPSDAKIIMYDGTTPVDCNVFYDITYASGNLTVTEAAADKNPATGDQFPAGLYGLIAALALCGVLAAARRKVTE